MIRPLFLLLAATLALLPAGLAHAACDLPLPSGADTPALPQVARALHEAVPKLDILVVGSATVLGERGSVSGSFPEAMAQALRAAEPKLVLSLSVNGVRGQTAKAMLDVLRQHLAGGHFGLVLWQTGTVEAVRRVPPPAFAVTLRQGVEMVHAAGADLVIIDPQFSEMLEATADLAPYRAAILAASAVPGTALLDRYTLMRDWAGAGLLDMDHIPRGGRARAVERLHACLGAMLARRILAGAAL
jgi:acyl-CoA thioesterase-1